MNNLEFAKLLQATKRALREHHITGDIWADDVPKMGTMRQEMLACDIRYELGVLPDHAHKLARRMIRSAVLTHNATPKSEVWEAVA